MPERFENKIAAGLDKIATACRKRKQRAGEVERRVGRLLGTNPRAAGLFAVRAVQKADGFVEFTWLRREAWRQWAHNSEGCYLLRSNVTDWTPEELWSACIIQLAEAETAFRIHKSDWPVWHQERERVEAHILACFLG